MLITFLHHSVARIFLAIPDNEHIDLMLPWVNDQDTRQFLGVFGPTTRGFETSWVANLGNSMSMRSVESATFLIVMKEEKKPIGTVGFKSIDWKNRHATMGISIGETEYRGKGYGSEAEMLMLSWAFLELGLKKVVAHIIAFNEQSLKAGEKCGFKKIGCHKHHHFKDGKWHDEYIVEVYAEKWRPLWEKFKKGEFLPKKVEPVRVLRTNENFYPLPGG